MPPIYYGSAPFALKQGSQALNLYYGSTLISGGGAPAVTDGVIATVTGQVATATASIANNFTSRRADFASPEGDITNLQSVDFSSYLAAPLTASEAHVIKRYLEYPANTFHQVKWGGATTVALGGVSPSSATSDVILSSITGLPLVIPASAKFWWRTVNVTGWTVGAFPVIVRPSGSVALGIDDGNSVSDLGNTGTVPATSTTNTFGPTTCIGSISKGNARSFILFGDSLVFGQNDFAVGTNYSSGWLSRGVSPYYPSLKIALPGVSAQTLATLGVPFSDFIARLGFSDVVVEAGINDLSGSSRTPAQIQADLQTIYGKFSAAARIWQTTMTARTNSTDAYATTVNQTAKVDGTYGQVNTLNGLIRAKPAPLFGIVDAADFDMTARDSVIHSGPFPPVSDGTHFLSAKAAAMGALVNAALAI